MDEVQQKLCEGLLTEQEIIEAIKAMSNNKTPGSDGLPIEFYKILWADIKEFFINAVHESFETGELSTLQRHGIITLLPKQNKDNLYLKNWRPISLLQTDYKIIAKALATRMKKVLPDLIHKDQTGFLKNRYIGENIRKILDIIEICDEENIPALLAAIDFEKAFDKLEWSHINRCLEYFNFGPTFQKWIKTLYKNITSSVINNGYATETFTISRGVRQGCPISPYLFILCVEPLASALRASNEVKGIEIKSETYKLCQYADDTSLLLHFDEQSLREAFLMLNKFQSISGLKINLEKTKLLKLGSAKDIQGTLAPELNLEWTNEPISILGVQITTKTKDLAKLNFEPKVK